MSFGIVDIKVVCRRFLYHISPLVLLQIWNFSVYLHPKSSTGALAHLARALDWQSKGDEFESRMLHMDKKH